MKNLKKARGFTLIEILVVIGIIAVLAAIVIIAINPARQFAQARNSQRVSNVNAILNGVGQRIADNKGIFSGGTPNCPALTTGTVYTIGAGASASAVSPATATIDLSCLTPTYIPSQIPVDPGTSAGSAGVWNSATDYNTRYNITVDSNGRYTITAPNNELSQTITVTR